MGDRWVALFDDPGSFDSGAESDGIQWDGDDDLSTPDDTIPQEGCHPDQVLLAILRRCVPGADAGGPTGVGAGRSGFTRGGLNGEPSNIGAR